MDLQEYSMRITSALLREGDQLKLVSHNAFWNRLATHIDKRGYYSVVSIHDLFNHEAYIRLIKGEAVATGDDKVHELEAKLDRAEWVRQEAKKRVAERRRKMNAN